jgi:small subunit ribosomal protein S6
MKLQRNRTYECMCLLDNREVRKGWEPLKQAVSGMFQKHGAKVLSNRRWDERRLAYAIEGQNRATYLLLYFAADTQSLGALRRDLEFSEPMLRYLITECEEVPESAYEPEAEFDVASIPVDDAPAAPAPAERRSDARASADDAATPDGDASKSDSSDGDSSGDESDSDSSDGDSSDSDSKDSDSKDGDDKDGKESDR